MNQYKFIPCDIFKRGVYIFIGEPKEMEDWIRSFFTDEEDKDFVAIFSEPHIYGAADTHYGYGHCVVRIAKLPEEPKEYAELAHECLHAADSVLTYSGVEWQKNSNNETFTYTMEWLMRCALEKEGYEETDRKDS